MSIVRSAIAPFPAAAATTLVLGLASLFCLPTASAAAYRWTDASGGVHYSQVPPTNRPYQSVPASGAPSPIRSVEAAAPAADGAPKLSETEEFLRRAAEADAQKLKKAQTEKSTQAVSAKQCETARARLQFLDEHPSNRLMQRDAGGVPSRVTSEQWDAQRAEASKLIADSCR